jgi:preprotein translocase subunit SecE
MADNKEEKVKQPNAFQKWWRESVQKWWRETLGELRKVNWPTRQEAERLTRIVLIVMVAMSALLGILDFVFSWAITTLLA